MTNQIKLIKNPNSPEAIQMRLDGYADTTPYSRIFIVDDKAAGTIFIDLTQDKTHQRLSYTPIGGHAMSKRLVKTSFSKGLDDRQIITLYYTDVYNSQWVIIKDYTDLTSPGVLLDSTPHFPSSTYGGTYGGFGSSPRGENWRNEGRSTDDIVDAQKRQFATTSIDPKSNNDVENPEEGLYNPYFSGIK